MTGSSSAGGGLSPTYISRPVRERSKTGGVGLTMRFAGALALAVMGGVHLQQFLGAHYSDIPTIGTLFALNFAGAILLALGLLAPLERVAGRRGAVGVTLSALGGIAIAAASIVFLFVSENQKLFGFRESGYRPAIIIALAAEAAAAILLAWFLAARATGNAREW